MYLPVNNSVFVLFQWQNAGLYNTKTCICQVPLENKVDKLDAYNYFAVLALVAGFWGI